MCIVGRGLRNLAHHRFAVGFPGIFTCACAIALLARRRRGAAAHPQWHQHRLATHDVNQNHSTADKAPEQPWSTAMLAEIFMLRLEAAARAAKEAPPPSQFVPITLAAAKVS